MSYTVVLEPKAERAIRKLPPELGERVSHAAYALGDDPRPHGYRKLHGRGDRYRIRVGDYRIIYEIKDDVLIVLVVEVGPRDSIY